MQGDPVFQGVISQSTISLSRSNLLLAGWRLTGFTRFMIVEYSGTRCTFELMNLLKVILKTVGIDNKAAKLASIGMNLRNVIINSLLGAKDYNA